MDNLTARISIEQAAGQLYGRNSGSKIKSDNQVTFQEILLQKKNQAVTGTDTADVLKFSRHADARLSERSINLTDEQMQRLTDGAKLAGAKGITETLVIMDNLAFIVNTKSNIVITAMDQSYEKENIYTNIDGAVII